MPEVGVCKLQSTFAMTREGRDQTKKEGTTWHIVQYRSKEGLDSIRPNRRIISQTVARVRVYKDKAFSQEVQLLACS
eukprot:1158307-Pelagomonas_calceolata.AAC.14